MPIIKALWNGIKNKKIKKTGQRNGITLASRSLKTHQLTNGVKRRHMEKYMVLTHMVIQVAQI